MNDLDVFLAHAIQESAMLTYQSAMNEVRSQYPVIGQHEFHLRPGEGPGHAEVFFPTESYNPAPGLNTIEIRNRDVQGKELQSLIAGETLHWIGAIDPRTKEPVDKTFRSFKGQLRESLTKDQLEVDRKEYLRARREDKEHRSFDDWMDQSRTDAYIRGWLFPDKENDWVRSGAYTSEQAALLERMRQYLQIAK